MSEYSGGLWSRDYIAEGSGELIATENASGLCTTCYFGYDHLGSVRIVMDQNGGVVARHDYLPFGEELPGGAAGRTTPGFGAADLTTQRFTGQVRDSESGLDFFNARYFMAPLGRFNSADPMNAGASLGSSQSWNGYAYVLGNPLNYIDPSGRDCITLDDGRQALDQDHPQGGCGSLDENGNDSDPESVSTSADVSNVTTQDLYEFYQYWQSGALPPSINYGPKDGMTKLLAKSGILSSIRSWYRSQGCPAQASNVDSGHFAPFVEGVIGLNKALFQVGGFQTTISTSGNTTTFTITNIAGQASFSGGSSQPTLMSAVQASYELGAAFHIITPGTFAAPLVANGITDNPQGPTGPYHNVTQTFTWSESGLCK